LPAAAREFHFSAATKKSFDGREVPRFPVESRAIYRGGKKSAGQAGSTFEELRLQENLKNFQSS
jgi:hypothetical protein